jgi:pyrimidine deaminase RibD-like protein
MIKSSEVFMSKGQPLSRNSFEKNKEYTEYEFMKLAIEEAKASEGREDDPKVGAVLVKDGKLVGSAHREQKDHAEFTLLHKKLRSTALTQGTTLYTTLEPCTTRGHDKLPCADWVVNKGIRCIVIGILDPNPTICGKGYWIFIERGIDVYFFPPELAREIKEINKIFIDKNRGNGAVTLDFDWFIQKHKHKSIQRYIGLGWDEALTLLQCPSPREGWSLEKAIIRLVETKPFEIPKIYKRQYDEYHADLYQEHRFRDDKESFMLVKNPTAFTDSPSLILDVRPTKYSYLCFYRDYVSTLSARKDPLVEEFVQGRALKANFSGGFVMQMVVVTRDNKILLLLRSPKVDLAPNTWSVSVEEHISREDFSEGEEKVALRWAVRLLKEELGLDMDAYYKDSIRILSVFMETDCLYNSLCVYTPLRLDHKSLEVILKGRLKEDYEYVDFAFLDIDKQVLLGELVSPGRTYHPTSGYRMLYAFIKIFGSPSKNDMAYIKK